MPGFFDPGHGFLSSSDEVIIALVALILLTVIGGVAEYFGNSKGGTVLGALVGFLVVVLLVASPVFASEWHYAVVVAIPIAVLVYLYRGRRD